MDCLACLNAPNYEERVCSVCGRVRHPLAEVEHELAMVERWEASLKTKRRRPSTVV